MKRHISKILAVILIFCTLISFSGCSSKTTIIPDGLYAWHGDNNLYESVYALTENNVRDSYGIEIKGDMVQRWVSGSVDYKAKIVEIDGETYFEGYKWRDLWDILFRNGKEKGVTDTYRVAYDKTEKSMTLILVKYN